MSSKYHENRQKRLTPGETLDLHPSTPPPWPRVISGGGFVIQIGGGLSLALLNGLPGLDIRMLVSSGITLRSSRSLANCSISSGNPDAIDDDAEPSDIRLSRPYGRPPEEGARGTPL